MLAGLGILVLASILGTAAIRVLRELSDEALGPVSDGSGFFWSILPLIVPALFTFPAFLLLYRYVPSAHTRISGVWPGALLATVAFELLKNLYALYVAKFNNYDVVYGALGGILLFMLYAYLTANIILIGAELAAEYPRVMRGDYVPPPSAGAGLKLYQRGWLLIKSLFVRQPTIEPPPAPPQHDEAGTAPPRQ
jgi:YihY family inner membrane protein